MEWLSDVLTSISAATGAEWQQCLASHPLSINNI